jgi:hypothetical protein
MTYQRDPNDMDTRRDYVRRDDGSFGMLPIILAVAVVLGIGYLFYGMSRTDTVSAPGATSERIERPAPTPSATPSPPATTAPKQP